MKRLVFAFVFFLLLQAWAEISSAEFYLVRKSSDQSEKEISVELIRQIYLGKKSHWPNRVKASPIQLHSSRPEMLEFLESIVGMNARQYNNHWRRKLFSGRGRPPRIINSNEDAIVAVKGKPGSIALITRMPVERDGLWIYDKSSQLIIEPKK